MERRGFLKVLIGGAAAVALPSSVVGLRPSKSFEELANLAAAKLARPASKSYLRVVITYVEDGEQATDYLHFPLDPEAWIVERGTFTYGQPIEFIAEREMTVADAELHMLTDFGDFTLFVPLDRRVTLGPEDRLNIANLHGSISIL